MDKLLSTLSNTHGRMIQILVLLCFLLVQTHGRPAQSNARQSALQESLIRAINYLTKYGYLKAKKTHNSGGVISENPDKIHHGLPENYLTDISNLFDEVFTEMEKKLRETSETRVTEKKQRKEKSLAGFSQDEIEKALLKLQSFSQIKLTGRLDDDTKQMMKKPRCGIKDMDVHEDELTQIARKMRVRTHRRVRRYALQGSKWKKSIIKWGIPSNKWSSKVTAALVKSTLEAAFRSWAEVSPLVFRFVSNSALADITILFAQGYHGDFKAFDGPGNELAHAYYPQYGGDIHFDDAEPWTPRTSDRTHKSLFKVAIHEIGHSLGLYHSSVSGAIMNPVYSTLGDNLGDDDIRGIQAIYGLCDPLSIRSIESSMHNGFTYIFKDSNYYRFDDLKDRVSTGYPKPSSKWYGIPDQIDEMFLWGHNWKIYFFKGSYYYRYNEYYDRADAGYPRLISSGWPGVPNDIDAAFTVDSDTSYFFKGNLCYKFDNRLDRVAYGYPRSISQEWPGAPDNMDGAFRWMYNGVFYFFKGEYYWKWDSNTNYAQGTFRIKQGWKNICDV